MMTVSEPGADKKTANLDRIRELRDQITDLKKRWPAHSTPPAMLQRLEDLEEELEIELALARQSK
jgi:hypothetical protein